MFITIEGIDGSGKSTQIELLNEYLQSIGKEVLILREPGGTQFSEQIREILLSNKNKLNSTTELFLFEAARSKLCEDIIKPALESGKIVLCDRFYDSTTAYQGFGRGLSLELIHRCNEAASLGLIPDVTFYLDIDFEESQNRSQKREKDRIEKSGKEFFLRIIDGFRQISKFESDRVIRIDASGDIFQTHEIIRDIIEKKLNN